MILRLRCTCGRNLLDVHWTTDNSAHPGGWVDPRARSSATWTPARNQQSLLGRLWTHNLRCRCGENWRLSEERLAHWWREQSTASDGKIGHVVRMDLGAAG